MIKCEIATSENLAKLSEFYAQIPEYGDKNILSNKLHLFWKHLENPYGKSQLFFEILGNQIIAAIILQRRPPIKNNCANNFLACDMAIRPEHRKLSRFINLWKEVKTFCNNKFDNNYIIYHSSNYMSEPLYNSLSISKKSNKLVPYLFFPSINLNYSISKSKFVNKPKYLKEEKFYNWRFNKKSQIQYFNLQDLRKCKECHLNIFYRIQKLYFFNCLIFLNNSMSPCNKCDFNIRNQIIRTMIKHRSVVAIWYAPENLKKDFLNFFKNWHKVPKKLTPYIFPIYLSDFYFDNDSNKLNYLFLEDLDVF